MLQLVPFFFMNQVVFAFVMFVLLMYIFSKFMLPSFVRLFMSKL